jgi:hypothetical protein
MKPVILDVGISKRAGNNLFCLRPRAWKIWHFSPSGETGTACGLDVDWGNIGCLRYSDSLPPGTAVCAKCFTAFVTQGISE